MTEKFDPSSVRCRELFADEGDLYRIPEFQRPYSWQEKHVQQLWDDLYESWQEYEEGEIESYYLGPIILIEESGEDRLSVLDGQQRLTTITIFYSVLKHLHKDKLNDSNSKRVENRLKQDTLDKYRLKTSKNNHADFIQTILQDIDLNEDNRYIESANTINDNISDNFRDKNSQLNDFVEFIDSQTEFIKIESNNLSKAIRLFQTINTRGKDLTVSDLTKSYLLSQLPSKERREAFVEVWEQISNTVNEDYDELDNILQSYRLYLQTEKANEEAYIELKSEFESNDREPLEIVREIKSFTEEFVSLENSENKFLRILRNLKHKRYWKTALVASRMDNRGEDYEHQLCKELVSFYYSYWIAGYTSQKIKKPSYQILRKTKQSEGLEDIYEYLTSKRQGDNIPSEVRESLHEDNVYKKSWHRNLLTALEYIQYTDRKVPEVVLDKDTHVEHILPRMFETAREKHDEWAEAFSEDDDDLVNSLGNLTLLQYDLNESASQKPFSEKKKIYAGEKTYKKTSFELSERILNYEEWTPESIRDNHEYLLDQVAELLNIDRDKLEPLDGEENQKIMNPGFSDSEKGELVWEKNELPKSDAQHVGAGTNVTGQLRFGQAGFKVNDELINQYEYFRNDIFRDQDWYEKPDDPDMEVADIWFRLEINGDDLGFHQLEVRHKPDWEAGQANVTTMLRWGEIIGEIKERELTGKDFRLYKPKNGDEPFFIEID